MPNTVFLTKGVLIAKLKEAGMKEVSPRLVEIDELLPELTDDELRKLRDWALFADLEGHA